MKKILFITSTTSVIKQRSGEIEMKALQLGFQLNGYKCHVFGLNADDFDTYDYYFVFSLSSELIPLLDLIPKGKRVVFFPQTESYTSATVEKLKNFMRRDFVSFISVRTQVEMDFYSKEFGCSLLRENLGYFVEPFVWNISEHKDIASVGRYILSFGGKFQIDQYQVAFDFAKKSEAELLVFVSDSSAYGEVEKGFRVYPRLPYGSNMWYDVMINSWGFYEPHPRITSSLLEMFALGKPVWSDNFFIINKLLNFEWVGEPKVSTCFKPEKPTFAQLFMFRSEVVAFKILKELESFKC